MRLGTFDIDLDSIRSENALNNLTVTLTKEEAICVYSQLTENDKITLGVITKIIEAVPSARNTENSFAKNLVLDLQELFNERL